MGWYLKTKGPEHHHTQQQWWQTSQKAHNNNLKQPQLLLQHQQTQELKIVASNANDDAGRYYDGDREDALLAAVRTAVSTKHTFKNQHFITCDNDECFGSPWQKEVCHVARVDKYVKQFWSTKGMAEARWP
jgi:hypothetical protein